MPSMAKETGRPEPKIAAASARKTALSSISFNPVTFLSGTETPAGHPTYNRVEDKV